MTRVDEGRPALWLWPNLLSLDAPLVAALWQGFLAYRFAIPLRPAGRIVLFLSVWAIYLADRLLDARKPPMPSEPARHRFYRRHSGLMMMLLALITLLDGAAALLLRTSVLREGMIPLAGVLVYLAIFHASGKWIRIPKEVAAAVLFTVGTFVAAWALLPCASLAWAALAFFVLCLANMVAIEAWERDEPAPHPLTRWLARSYLCWVPAAVIVCLLVGRNDWYESIAVSGAACAALVWFGKRLSLDARRVLVDGVLLSPLLFLMLR